MKLSYLLVVVSVLFLSKTFAQVPDQVAQANEFAQKWSSSVDLRPVTGVARSLQLSVMRQTEKRTVDEWMTYINDKINPMLKQVSSNPVGLALDSPAAVFSLFDE